MNQHMLGVYSYKYLPILLWADSSLRIGVFISILLVSMLLSGCQTEILPTRGFQTEDLLIDEMSLPDGWKVLSIDNDPLINLREESAVEMIFYHSGDDQQLIRGVLSIFRHQTEQDASWSYEYRERGSFNDTRSTTPLFIPVELDFKPLSADKWQLGCHGISDGLLEDTTICHYLGKYEEYVVILNFPTVYDHNAITSIEQLNDLLLDMDVTISETLDSR